MSPSVGWHPDPNEGARPPRRRRRRRVAQAMMVSAVFCILPAIFFLLVSLRQEEPSCARLQRRVALGFLIAGAALGVARAAEAARVNRRLRQIEAEAAAEEGRSGMALVAAVAIGAALAALALHALAAARAGLRAAESAALGRRLGALAAGEVRRRLRDLADDRDPLVDHLGEDWARPAEFDLPEGIRLESRVEDENRRFNLNHLARAAAESERRVETAIASELLSLAGAPDPRRRLDALRAAMRVSGADAEPKFAPLSAWGDLTAIEGFDRDFLEREADGVARRIRPADAFTVAPFDALQPWTINLNTAPEGVLLALFGRARGDAVRAALSLREAAPLRSLEPLALVADPVTLLRLRPWIGVRSTLFRVEARAAADGRERRVRALARREGDGAVRILEWTEL